MPEQTENQSAAALAIASIGVGRANDGAAPFVLLPEGYEAHNLESTLNNPTRARGAVNLYDVDSFIATCKSVLPVVGGAGRLYGRRTAAPGFLAVFNDHAPGTPGWGDWCAIYNCPVSVEWGTWMANNGKAKTQTDFARFIEDNLPDIVEPASVDMLEISRTLEAKKKVDFKSSIRLQDGQNEFAYEEQIEGTAGKGRLRIPETFTIGIKVLEGGPTHQIKARLRYRIGTDAKLQLWYDLERPHKDLEFAVNSVWTRIEGELGVKILHGAPGPALGASGGN